MLILTRRPGESIRLDDEITVTLLGVQGMQARIGINAPDSVHVHREEIYQGIQAERAASQKDRVNQISETGENVNQRQSAPPNIPEIIPAGWTDKQVLDFCSVALRHVVVNGDLKFSDINDALRHMADKGEPAFVRAFDMDEHVKLVQDALRYRWLRNRTCIEDADNDLMVVRGDRYFDGAELDTEVDNGMRLERLLEKHGEPV